MLGYLNDLSKSIRPYHSAMLEFDKSLTAGAFRILDNKNTKCSILVATNAYKIGINNPDMRLLVQ